MSTVASKPVVLVKKLSLMQQAQAITNPTPVTTPKPVPTAQLQTANMVSIFANQPEILKITAQHQSGGLLFHDAIADVILTLLDMPICANMTDQQLNQLGEAIITHASQATSIDITPVPQKALPPASLSPADLAKIDPNYAIYLATQARLSADKAKQLSTSNQRTLDATASRASTNNRPTTERLSGKPGDTLKMEQPKERQPRECGITSRKQFLDKAPSANLTLSIQGQKQQFVLTAESHQFSTGSLGYYFNGKVTLVVDGQEVTFQVGCNMIAVNSKEVK